MESFAWFYFFQPQKLVKMLPCLTTIIPGDGEQANTILLILSVTASDMLNICQQVSIYSDAYVCVCHCVSVCVWELGTAVLTGCMAKFAQTGLYTAGLSACWDW